MQTLEKSEQGELAQDGELIRQSRDLMTTVIGSLQRA